MYSMHVLILSLPVVTFSRPLKMFGNRLDLDQARQKVEPDPYPKILDALILFPKHCLEAIIENKSADHRKHPNKMLNLKEVKA